MGILDRIKGKKEEKESVEVGSNDSDKYGESCAMCGQPSAEKKWMGQYWHKKCLRKSKKYAKGML